MLASEYEEASRRSLTGKCYSCTLRAFLTCLVNSVSLKTKLSALDLHRLISDVRRRVEHEITFEGTEKRTKYASKYLLFVLSDLIMCKFFVVLAASNT